jgi:hypothetical protein
MAISTEPRTRRAILFGALGGLGALAARSLGAAEPADAANPVLLGSGNSETAATVIRNTSATAGSIALVGRSMPASGVGIQAVAEGSNGRGVYGVANTGTSALGVFGTAAQGTGVRGNGVTGVLGSGTVVGMNAYTASSTGYGVNANAPNGTGVKARGAAKGVDATATAANGMAVSAMATGTNGTGVYGNADGYAGYFVGGTYGVYGSGTSNGVYGSSAATGVRGAGGSVGVQGENASNAGVRGYSAYVGVWGQGDLWGTYSIPSLAAGQVYGVMGANDSPAGYGVWSDGNCHVNGTLSKVAGAFKIDHPLDPENKWLQHSFVESPDMMNIYNGIAVIGARGQTTVQLPKYFTALNKDFRYQLTTIGGYAPVYVAAEINGGRFTIAGGRPGLKVSWQVTGIRHDDYAREHPIVVEARKTRTQRGMRAFVPAGITARKWSVRPRSVPFHEADPSTPKPLAAPHIPW